MAGRVVAEARSWIGTPYCHQGHRKGVGCDCLGLVRGVWRALYGNDLADPGPYSADWTSRTGGEALLDGFRRHFRAKPATDASPGAVLLFRWRPHMPLRHAGILVSEAAFVHAYEGSRTVALSPLVPQWRRRIGAVFDFPDLF
jgi:NlpC/P60 family putative phage cell wall peptidase